jgi:hypothetical protein
VCNNVPCNFDAKGSVYTLAMITGNLPSCVAFLVSWQDAPYSPRA